MRTSKSVRTGLFIAGSHFVSALNVAGLAVYFALLTDTDGIMNNSCPGSPEHPHGFFQDKAKLAFMFSALARFLPFATADLVSYLKSHLQDWDYLNQQVRTVGLRVESEAVDSLETALFSFLLAMQYKKSSATAIPSAIISLWPVAGLILKQVKPDFCRGDIKTMKDQWATNNEKALIAASVFESLYDATSLGLAMEFIAFEAVNLLYNTEHSKNSTHQSLIANTAMGAGAVLGGLAILHKKGWKLMRALEAGSNILLYTLLFTGSTMLCLDENIMTPEGFSEHGWKILLTVFATVSLPSGLFAGVQNTKNPYEEPQEPDEQAGTWLAGCAAAAGQCSAGLLNCFTTCFQGLGSCLGGIKEGLQQCGASIFNKCCGSDEGPDEERGLIQVQGSDGSEGSTYGGADTGDEFLTPP